LDNGETTTITNYRRLLVRYLP